MPAASLESLVEHAAQLRSTSLAFERAAFVHEPDPPVAIPDAAPVADAFPRLQPTDPAAATLAAEAVTLAALRAPWRAYLRAWNTEPIALPGEPTLELRALPWFLPLEPNQHLRAAIAREADARAQSHLAAARSMVDAVREVASRLKLGGPSALHAALGWGDTGEVRRAASAVLVGSAEAFAELDGWIRVRVGVARSGELSWQDRLRTLESPRANERIPAGDRAGIASRWIERIGLGGWLAHVRDHSRTAHTGAIGTRVFALAPGERVTIEGTLDGSARGTVELAERTGEALALAAPAEPRTADRLGRDRIHPLLVSQLARSLFADRNFVTREASVDRGSRESVLMELLHGQLVSLRAHAALALFDLDALDRARDLPARFREALVGAIGTAPAPAWAAHAAAHLFDGRSGARTVAAALEPHWAIALRNAHDEDWFRNPRAGETLRARIEAARSSGTIESLAATPEARDALFVPTILSRHLAGALESARR